MQMQVHKNSDAKQAMTTGGGGGVNGRGSS
jgi:hypothetical protein